MFYYVYFDELKKNDKGVWVEKRNLKKRCFDDEDDARKFYDQIILERDFAFDLALEIENYQILGYQKIFSKGELEDIDGVILDLEEFTYDDWIKRKAKREGLKHMHTKTKKMFFSDNYEHLQLATFCKGALDYFDDCHNLGNLRKIEGRFEILERDDSNPEVILTQTSYGQEWKR